MAASHVALRSSASRWIPICIYPLKCSSHIDHDVAAASATVLVCDSPVSALVRQNMELVEELQLNAEPLAPPRRSKYASGGQLGEITGCTADAAAAAVALMSACQRAERSYVAVLPIDCAANHIGAVLKCGVTFLWSVNCRCQCVRSFDAAWIGVKCRINQNVNPASTCETAGLRPEP